MSCEATLSSGENIGLGRSVISRMDRSLHLFLWLDDAGATILLLLRTTVGSLVVLFSWSVCFGGLGLSPSSINHR